MKDVLSRKHEIAFCAEVSKWADKIFETNRSLPFGSSEIEDFVRHTQKRNDFRIYERKTEGRGKLALCGEVKLPGTPEGRSPFTYKLMQDAYNKATDENCRYFFTWNVEHLAVFDRSRWNAESMHERCIAQWQLGLELNKPTDVSRPEVISQLRDVFLPTVLKDFASVWIGQKPDLRLPPSDFYVSVLESHLAGPMGPVRELRDYLATESERRRQFDAQLRNWMAIEQQWSFDKKDPQSWRQAIDRAARSIAYILSNRILFYQAVKLRNDLPQLKFPRSITTPQKAFEYLRDRFQDAVRKTGDYEPVFFPDVEEWAALTALSGANSLEAWDRFITAVDRFNLREISTDILGHIFQKLISPEERHKFGQHYTDENIVDVINAFCIRKGDAVVLDPACGSGTFLVRAYYRKSFFSPRLTNQDLIKDLYGCDINPFPAHLATLNLAARSIANEENYPRVIRRNFFTVEPEKVFCEIPKTSKSKNGHRDHDKVILPSLDAIIGNPPYVRYQEIPRLGDKGALRDQTKDYLYQVVERAWPGIKLSKQSDLHVYFWPVATQFLVEKGTFGFLTSSSWLDAKYGFRLQRWILMNFRIVTIIESVKEPWFEDARIKTCVTILERCSSEHARNSNIVRFVRLKHPLDEVLGSRDSEQKRQESAELLRDAILEAKSDVSNDHFRIMVRRQGDLWNEGLSVARMLEKHRAWREESVEDITDDNEDGGPRAEDEEAAASLSLHDYGGGKWGRYLRAPDFYFQILRQFASKFTCVGHIASIKYGILSGCDGFFMPRDVSRQLMQDYPDELKWQSLPLMKRCKRREVASGQVVIVECGDGTLHPIESKFVRPELHSLMQVSRPIVTADQLNRVALWVDHDLKDLKGSYVYHYITWGSKQTFASKKSKSVPIPERPGCQGRQPWYNLVGREIGIGFWPMAQKYRHIVPWNRDRVPCNHNLFAIHAEDLTEAEQNALVAVLNSTLVGLFKHFYGRYAGAEGTLKTEVVDVLMLEIPSPAGISANLASRLTKALEQIAKREVTHLVEQQFLECHTEADLQELQKQPWQLPLELGKSDRKALDLLVFELLGVSDHNRREELVQQLYKETTLYYREQRIQDIRSNINKTQGTGSGKTVSPYDLASAAWEELENEWKRPIAQWIEEETSDLKTVELPDGEITLPAAGDFFDSTTLFFGKTPAIRVECGSRAECELLAMIAGLGIRGRITVSSKEQECRRLIKAVNSRLSKGRELFEETARQYAGNEKLRSQMTDLLWQWLIHGYHPEN